jgi:hypothetical protein
MIQAWVPAPSRASLTLRAPSPSGIKARATGEGWGRQFRVGRR